MIKNVVFDLGRVLITYDPHTYIKNLGYNDEKTAFLKKAIFGHEVWRELDRGTYRFKDAIDIYSNEYPEYADDIKKLLSPGWQNILKPINENIAFLTELKASGYKIYILSNFSEEGFAYIEAENEFFKLADGKVISSYVNFIKPEKEIYEFLLTKYGLDARETVFIDDLPENIKAAEELGIHGILYETIEKLRRDFLILCK